VSQLQVFASDGIPVASFVLLQVVLTVPQLQDVVSRGIPVASLVLLQVSPFFQAVFQNTEYSLRLDSEVTLIQVVPQLQPAFVRMLSEFIFVP
jgi:hypothetical protein